ncbi:MAG: hypothetical protein KYX66_06805 [Blastomonas fulva]|uniref:hypothetical protein n=1 Tax=Blastomonas fulva TaxID=1550728 RepID=UPI0024E1BBFC|nr:hypothetical protein [Blastomonas fulva]MDK2756428.1 hypothetical protein [Blastomonas fulva]
MNSDLKDARQSLAKGGELDPAALDVAKRPRQRVRNRPDPSPELRAWEADADKRVLSRPLPPGVMLEPAGYDEEHWTAPHNDASLWTLQLADAFGTRSKAVFITFMQQLERLTGKAYWDDDAKQWRIDENEFSASLAIVNSTKPRNEIEACQAAQMVALHLLTMKCAAYAIRHEHDSRSAMTVAKLCNAFSGQVEAMQTLKGKRRTARQSITVKKEVSYHAHQHDHRGGCNTCDLPHGRKDSNAATIDDPSHTVRSKDTGGNVVPLPRSKGKDAV